MNTKELEEIKGLQKKQAEYYGLENRLYMLSEECAELIQAVNKYNRTKANDYTCKSGGMTALYKITEEMADVENVLEQVKYLLKNQNKTEKIKGHKVKRTEQYLLNDKKYSEKQTKTRVKKARIVHRLVSYFDRNNNKFIDRHYYEIEYESAETGEIHIGYGSYSLDVVIEWFNRCFEFV